MCEQDSYFNTQHIHYVRVHYYYASTQHVMHRNQAKSNLVMVDPNSGNHDVNKTGAECRSLLRDDAFMSRFDFFFRV